MTKEDKKIDDLGIYELRILARQVGVKSPTSKKREDLLAAIKDILEGKEDPYTRKDGRGRPSKNISTLEEFSNVLIPSSLNYDVNHEDKYVLSDNHDKSFVFMQNFASYELDEKAQEEVVKGVVDRNRMGVWILRTQGYDYSEDDVFISNAFTKTNHLQVGDYLEGRAKYYEKDKPRALIHIDSINHISVEDYALVNPAVVTKQNPKQYVSKRKVTEGKRALWIFEGRQNVSEKALDICNDFDDRNTHIFNICLNNLDCESIMEGQYYYYIPVSFVKEETSRLLATKLGFKRAQILAMQGNQVIVVFNAITTFLKAVEKFEGMNAGIQLLKEYLSYSKCYDNGGSLTILCLENSAAPENLSHALEYELLDVFHSVENNL